MMSFEQELKKKMPQIDVDLEETYSFLNPIFESRGVSRMLSCMRQEKLVKGFIVTLLEKG